MSRHDATPKFSSYRTTLRRHGVAITGPRTISQSYEVLQNRVCASKNRALQYSVTIHELAFVKRDGQLVFQKSLYASRFPLSGYFLMIIFNPQEYEVEPYPIQNLTSEILSYLQPLPEGRRSGFSEKSILMKKLPTEIIEHICLHLHPFAGPGAACTYKLSPNIWRDLLFRQQLLPWLWDLDPAILESQPLQHSNGQPSYSKDDFWDWEQLVRKLAQVEAFEPGNSLENAPLRLRNRKRIWRLLEMKADVLI
ncbi:hypothetical protein TEQG_08192 [Trichophyton equinum CBS 127.97]|uniref:F-box domain-containing protein n=1 Tax=Trichophyton equinum (strain ATCC MYA-4606 / CBS 127.97) TaxID=559882 RepID=F2Q524_TRIEC|nr:hypothetical protein TEQG_08192 [Trichophyton equinum CBS 127.97]